MKSLLTVVLILFAACASGVAQVRKNRVVLTGSVQGISHECIGREWFAEVRVYFQFRNDTDSPVILYPPSNLFKTSIEFSNGGSSGGGHVVDSFRYRPEFTNRWGPATEEDYDRHPWLPRSFDTDEPSAAGMKTVEPGGYYEFVDTLWPKSGFKIEFTPRKMPSDLNSNLRHLWERQPCGVGQTSVSSEYRSFRIKYDLYLRKYAGATDLLKSLQTRWKSFGNLILASNDDIMFETEEILLDAKKRSADLTDGSRSKKFSSRAMAIDFEAINNEL